MTAMTWDDDMWVTTDWMTSVDCCEACGVTWQLMHFRRGDRNGAHGPALKLCGACLRQEYPRAPDQAPDDDSYRGVFLILDTGRSEEYLSTPH